MFPSLLCTAASNGNIEALQNLVEAVSYPFKSFFNDKPSISPSFVFRVSSRLAMRSYLVVLWGGDVAGCSTQYDGL